MLVFVALKRQSQTPVHAADSCFYSRINLRNCWQRKACLPPALAGDSGGGMKAEGISARKFFRHKGLEPLANDFHETLRSKSGTTKIHRFCVS